MFKLNEFGLVIRPRLGSHKCTVWLEIDSINEVEDSMTVIEWVLERKSLEVLLLHHCMDNIKALIPSFRDISFLYVYSEQKLEVDALCKHWVTLRPCFLNLCMKVLFWIELSSLAWRLLWLLFVFCPWGVSGSSFAPLTGSVFAHGLGLQLYRLVPFLLHFVTMMDLPIIAIISSLYFFFLYLFALNIFWEINEKY